MRTTTTRSPGIIRRGLVTGAVALAAACFTAAAVQADGNMTPTPTPAVKVTSVKGKVSRKSAYVGSRVKVSGPGTINQQARIGKGKQSLRCKASKRVGAAGTFKLKCKAGKKALRALRKRPKTLTLRTTFIPTEGTAVSVTKRGKVKGKL